MLKNSLLIASATLLAVALIFNHQLNSRSERQILFFNDQKIIAEVARTSQEKTLGLSGRRNLKPNHGLLFITDGEKGCIWMKDMNFSIDVLWFDEQYKLIDMANNVSPDTFPQLFCPNQKAAYILEVPANFPDTLTEDLGKLLLVR